MKIMISVCAALAAGLLSVCCAHAAGGNKTALDCAALCKEYTDGITLEKKLVDLKSRHAAENPRLEKDLRRVRTMLRDGSARYEQCGCTGG